MGCEGCYYLCSTVRCVGLVHPALLLLQPPAPRIHLHSAGQSSPLLFKSSHLYAEGSVQAWLCFVFFTYPCTHAQRRVRNAALFHPYKSRKDWRGWWLFPAWAHTKHSLGVVKGSGEGCAVCLKLKKIKYKILKLLISIERLTAEGQYKVWETRLQAIVPALNTTKSHKGTTKYG